MNLAELLAAHYNDRKRAHLARVLEVASNTVGNWASGKTPMPRFQAAPIAKWLGGGVTESAVLKAAAESRRQYEAANPSVPAADVLAAIKADPNLRPDAKKHLMNQYALLLQLTGQPTTAPGDSESLAKNTLLVEGTEKAKRTTGAKSRPNG